MSRMYTAVYMRRGCWVERMSAMSLPTGEKEVVSKLPTGLDNLAVGPDDQVYVSSLPDVESALFRFVPTQGKARP
jgi:hypothetical protein